MRTIVEFTASSEDGDIQARLKRSLTEYGWTMPEIGIERQKIVGMVTDIFRSVKKSGRDLPVSTSSAEIQTVIDAYVKASPHSTDGSEPEGSPGAKMGRAELFTHYSFERTCLEQALLILTQIDPNVQQRRSCRLSTLVRRTGEPFREFLPGPLQWEDRYRHAASDSDQRLFALRYVRLLTNHSSRVLWCQLLGE